MKRTAMWFLLVLITVPSVYAQEFLNKGKAALTAHDTATAVQAFSDAVKAGQKEGVAYFYLGAIAAARHQVDSAQSYLEKAVKIDDDNADAMGLLAGVYGEKKNYPLALTTFRKAQKLAPKSAAIASAYGKTLLAADSVDAAIAQLFRARELNETDPTIFASLGEAYSRQNVVPMAVMNYQKAIELSPNEARYHFQLAQIYDKDRQYLKAIAEYDSVMVVDTTNIDVCLDIGKILSKASGESKKYALRPLVRFVDKRPNSVEGAELLAKVLFQLGALQPVYYEEAVKYTRHALDLNAGNVEMKRWYANSLEETKKHAEALKVFEELQKMNALKPEDAINQGKALIGAGREEEGRKLLEKAMTTLPDSLLCDAYFDLGSQYMKTGDYLKASQMFEKKIACDPKSLSSYLNAALCHMAMKEWDRTRGLLDSVLALNPNFTAARLNLARYFLSVDSLDKANEQYDIVIGLLAKSTDPKSKLALGEAHFYKATAAMTKSRYAQAIEELRRAKESTYDNASMQLVWGQCILQTLSKDVSDQENDNKKAEALTHFRRSVQMDPGIAAAHYWLGQTLIMMRKVGDDAGNKKLETEACSEYKSALRIAPKDPANVKNVKQAMEKIGCQ